MNDDATTLVAQLRGRAEFCRDRGEVKSPGLMEKAAEEILALRNQLQAKKEQAR